MDKLPFEHQLLYDIIGEEKYIEVCVALGGSQFTFKKNNKEVIHHYYFSKNKSIKEIASHLHITERYVRQVIALRIKS